MLPLHLQALAHWVALALAPAEPAAQVPQAAQAARAARVALAQVASAGAMSAALEVGADVPPKRFQTPIL